MSVENKDELANDIRLLSDQMMDRDADLRRRVRDLVTRVLVRREIEPAQIRAVMNATLEGVGEGLRRRGDMAGSALKDAVGGLDEAVGRSVYALRMALEETRGEGRAFAETDVKITVEAVRELERDLLDTLKRAADHSQGWLKVELVNLRAHLQRTGTDTGTQVRSVLETLNNRLSAASAGSTRDARAAASETKERLAAVASGILRGLADAIDNQTR